MSWGGGGLLLPALRLANRLPQKHSEGSLWVWPYEGFLVRLPIRSFLQHGGWLEQMRTGVALAPGLNSLSATFRNPRKVAGLKSEVLPDPRIGFLLG